jgi:hypothetical protein
MGRLENSQLATLPRKLQALANVLGRLPAAELCGINERHWTAILMGYRTPRAQLYIPITEAYLIHCKGATEEEAREATAYLRKSYRSALPTRPRLIAPGRRS